MANIRQARRRVYVILLVFLVIDIAAAAILFTPLAGSGTARQKEFDTLRGQVKDKMKTVIPPDQVQSRVNTAREQIADFYKQRIPSEASAISSELGKLAADNRVHMSSARYDEVDPDIPGLTRLHISASITGNYLQAVKFINSVERSRMFFVIDSVSLAEEQAGNVRLAVTLETYLRGAAE